ncbi:hypothetical protein ABK040_016767 [Willaertia magna]
MVMGVKPSLEFAQMTVEDCIAQSLAFLNLEEIQICRLVSKSWNELCIKGSVNNRDRYTFIQQGTCCYDLLLNKISYTLPCPIMNVNEMTKIESPYIHEYCTIYTNNNEVKKRVYSGNSLVFQFDKSLIGEYVFHAIDVPTGKVIWGLREQEFSEFKPLDVKMKQEKRFNLFKIKFLIQKDKERQEKVRQVFNDQMRLETNVSTQEWQKRLIDMQNELKDIRSFEESREFQEMLQKEKSKFFDDKLLFAYHDLMTKRVILQFDTYLVALNQTDGKYIGVSLLKERPVVMTNNNQPKEELLQFSCPLFPMDKTYIIPSLNEDVQCVTIFDRITLKEITTIKNIPQQIDSIIGKIPTENETFILIKSGSEFHLLSTVGKIITTFRPTDTIHIAKANIYSDENVVFDVDEGKVVFSGFDKDLRGIATGNPLLIYEDSELSLGGLIYLSKLTELEKGAVFGTTITNQIDNASCIKLVQVHVDFERHFRNREKVFNTILTPSLLGVSVLDTPYKQTLPGIGYYLYGEQLFVVLGSNIFDNNDERDNLEDEMEEEEEEMEEEREMILNNDNGDNYCDIYCINILSGTVIWKNKFKAPNNLSKFINIYPRASSLIVECSSPRETIQYILKINNGIVVHKEEISENISTSRIIIS